MGWTNSHLHQFEIDGAVYGDPELLYEGWQDETPPVDSLITRISEIVPQDGKRFGFRYEYDFGDRWVHEVTLKGVEPRVKGQRYPQCTAGERACPPEDCGGVPGYQALVEALLDPEHSEFEALGEWIPPGWGPELFKPENVRFHNPTRRWKRAFLVEG